jgi:carbamoyltransferase
MLILGLNSLGHDTSAAIVKDGKLLFAVEEERCNRKKHTTEFPINAINQCLNFVKAVVNDIDIISIGFIPHRYVKHKFLEHTLSVFPNANRLMMDEMDKVRVFLNNETIIRDKLGFKNEIRFLPHHTCHLASSFYMSNFKQAALLSIDGLGEIESSVTGYGNECNIFVHNEDKIRYPVSIGLLYAGITAYLGFRPFYDEQKVMGLSSYGNPDIFMNLFNEIVLFEPEGKYNFDFSYLTFQFERNSWFSKKFLDRVGPFRKPNEEITDMHRNIAASIQKVTENVMLHISKHLHEKTKMENLCLAGGVALNCVANGVLLKKGRFKNVYVQPGANDAGVAIGSALLTLYETDSPPERYQYPLTSYWGPEFDIKIVKDVLKKYSLEFQEYDDAAPNAARYLAEGKVISWFNGRMEFGPRALGNRSILGNPCSNKFKDYINKEVKKREWWRPLCPSMLYEKRSEYLENSIESPFMILMDYVSKDSVHKAEGIVHVDGTTRPQTVTKEQSPVFHHLIEEFYKITDVPVLLNTSQNRDFEPIVMTPEDAIECFIDTKIDYLVFNNQIIVSKKSLYQSKSEN